MRQCWSTTRPSPSTEEWKPATDLPGDDYGVVESGARHFIACLLGTETPVLTAEHARHVLDVTLQAYASIADGRTHEVETTFATRSDAG